MTLLWISIAAAVGLGLVFALINYSLFWFQRQAGHQFEEKFQDATQIIQSGLPPPSWTKKARQQIHHSGKNADQIARIGNQAKRRCLQQLHALLGVLENGRFYDSLETRQMLVEKLADIYAQWQHEPWERLINP